MRLSRLLLYSGLGLLGTALALLGVVLLVSEGVGGRLQGRGEIAQARIPAAAVAARQSSDRQILFGDLHVHTTFSGDAFVFSLPLLQGEGAHPPADACDFARFCAELDFWSINDHAEHLTPRQWDETKRSIRECNAVAGDPEQPDLVSFLGWEWTQSAPPAGLRIPERPHYGHKNVVLLDTEESRVPARPIGAGAGGLFATDLVPGAAWVAVRAGLGLSDTANLPAYLDFNRWVRELRGTDACSADAPVRDLPADCLEGAATPAELFAKLDDWGFESLVVPHGTAWGIHAPPGAELGIQLDPGMHDPARQRLFEVYSGHGSSERNAAMRNTRTNAQGEAECAPPADGYLPCCWRAGEIVRERCGDASEAVCEERVERARANFLAAGPANYDVVPGAGPDDWLECGQLADDFLPAFDYRPGMSAQFGLAARNPAAGEAGAFRFGLVASSDNHKARAGAGYKERARKAYGDAYGLRRDLFDRLGAPAPPGPESLAPDEIGASLRRLDPGSERGASYYYTAGLVAVHAEGRNRRAIFDALRARNAYGTSGPRILLWFDAHTATSEVPMGSELRMERSPRFTIRALGAQKQQPGCPEHTKRRLSPERLESLCLDECHHPSDERERIDRIEVVRIRPQLRPDEPIASLIDDPWRVFPCDDDGSGCAVEFEDESYHGEREHLYYVRALQRPTLAVNGDPMRCERDALGRCSAARSCPASGPDFDPLDDCLSPVRERAWSSPIWLRPGSNPPAPRRPLP